MNKIEYASTIIYHPMITSWLDGAIEQAVKSDHRLGYETLSGFFLAWLAQTFFFRKTAHHYYLAT